jgi:imidazole glycerol-phosphate synthase subunit HisF
MTRNVRIIARLEVKGPNLVKGIQFEGFRKLGDPHEFARRYYEDTIDEILYVDIVASLYERNNLLEIVRRATRDVFVPITVGGGIRSIGDVELALRSGADKVAVNTAALKRPELISEIARRFGSQCLVLSVQAKRAAAGGWECFYDNGRERTGIDAVEWIRRGHDLGAGEVLLISVDREGRDDGPDIDLARAASDSVPIPVIIGGGTSSIDHFEAAVREGRVDGVAISHLFHYGRMSVRELRQAALERGLNVRRC